MASIIDSLKEEAQCSLCNETPAEPKILKCFHTFCKKCLAEKNEFKEDERTFTCPTCKTKTDLPQCSDYDSLELSSFHSRILEVLSLTNPETSPEVKCPCKREKVSVAHCFDCARYLCEDCVEAHSTFTDGHHTAILADLQPEDYRRFLHRETPCDKPLHMKEFIKFYCNTCDLCACQLCILEEHQGLHDIVDIESRAKIQRCVLESLLQKLKIKETEQLTNLRYLEETACTMKTDAETTKLKVLKTAENLIAFIHENSRDLVQQIDTEVCLMSDKRTEQESLLYQTRSASEYVSKLCELGSAYLLLTNRASLECRCADLITSETGFTQVDHRKKFVPQDMAALRMTGLGCLKETKPSDPSKCTVQIQGTPGALSTIRLTVLTKDTAGKANHDPDDDVMITVEPKKYVREMQVSEKTGDKYEMEFNPGVPGRYRVEVKINTRHIENSPLEIDVRPQELLFTHELKMKRLKEPLEKPWGIAVNKSATKIAVTDCHSHCIVIFNMDGKLVTTIGSQGRGEGQLGNPHGVAFCSDNEVVTADEYNHRIQVFDINTGRCVKRFGRHGNGNGEFKNPLGVDVDDNGRIIVSDYLNNRVQVFTGEGEYLFQFDLEVHGETMFPVHAVAHGNAIIVSDYRNHVIHVFDEQDSLVTRRCVIGRRGCKDGELSYPRGIAVDKHGDILVCDRNNHRLQKFTIDGCLMATSTGYLGLPIYITQLPDGRFLCTDDERKKVLYIQSQ